MTDVKKTKPITVEAFRFVQLKEPQLYVGKSAEIDFIKHPNPDASAVLNKKESFVPLKALEDLRQLNESLYEFSFWLKVNKGQLTQDLIAQETKQVGRLENDSAYRVWDNLFYQTQVNSSAGLVQGLVQMLQADHFLKQYQTALKSEGEFPLGTLFQASKANVIIPQQLFQEKQPQSSVATSSLDAQSKDLLSNRLSSVVRSRQIKRYKDTVKQIYNAKDQYHQAYSIAHQQAYEAYQEEVKALQQSAQKITNEAGTIKICGKEIPPFQFEHKQTWDESYLKGQLSGPQMQLYQATKSAPDQTVDQTLERLEDSISRLTTAQFAAVQKRAPQTLIHEGINIPLRAHPLNNAYIFRAVPILGYTDHYSIYATQYYEMMDTKAYDIQVTATLSNGEQISSQSSTPVHETEHYCTWEVFDEGLYLPPGKERYQLQGQFKTQDETFNNNFSYKNLHPQRTVVAQEGLRATESSIPTPDLFGLMGVKIAEFKKVNQTLCCYVEGEVSHIENILAREYKERKTRNLMRTELTTERSRERESEQLTDTTSTERYEMQTEIAQMLQEDLSTNVSASASVGGSYKVGAGTLNFNVSGSMGTSSSSSSSRNFSEAESYAKEVTQRAMNRIVDKTTSKRTSKMIREFEEQNKHGFDNRESAKHVTGVYRWVDKIYRNDLVNYGKRLIYEFMLPEPAKNYKHLLQSRKVNSSQTVELTRPIPPTDFGIEHFWDITHNNLDGLRSYYNVEVEDYPVRFRRIAKSYSENFYNTGNQYASDKRWHGSASFKLEIPEGYLCTGFQCQFMPRRHGEFETIHGDMMVGNKSLSFNNERVYTLSGYNRQLDLSINNNSISQRFRPVEDFLPISVNAEDVGGFILNISAQCEIKNETYDAFRIALFSKIWAAYHEMKQAYNDATEEAAAQAKQDAAEQKANKKTPYRIPSAHARAIEIRELKRLIIEQISNKFSGFGSIPMGYNYYTPDPCNNTLNLVTNQPVFQKQMRLARFVEQAFDWEIMAYSFLPYYWGNEKEWGKLLSLEAGADATFLAFLQSGMANVVLPVKPGLEKSVAFLLETGRLWAGDGFILDGQDNLYPAIEQQLQIEVDENGNEIRYDALGRAIPVIEATWETRVPSTLTIVQNYSNPLDDQGLPCFCKDDKTGNIGYSADNTYNVLGPKTDGN